MLLLLEVDVERDGLSTRKSIMSPQNMMRKSARHKGSAVESYRV